MARFHDDVLSGLLHLSHITGSNPCRKGPRRNRNISDMFPMNGADHPAVDPAENLSNRDNYGVNHLA